VSEHKFTIRGEPVRWRYTRLRGKNDGYARFEPREVILHSGLVGRRRLECEIHEAIHQAFYDLDESVVLEVGKDLSLILWRLGYRISR
jgi:hypothetical protein